MNRFNKLAYDAYITFLCAEGFEDQEPEANNAKWYHLLWLLVPCIGFLAFVDIIKNADK